MRHDWGEVSIPTGADIGMLPPGMLSKAPLLKESVAGLNCCSVVCKSDDLHNPAVAEEIQLRAAITQTILEYFEPVRNVSNSTMNPRARHL